MVRTRIVHCFDPRTHKYPLLLKLDYLFIQQFYSLQRLSVNSESYFFASKKVYSKKTAIAVASYQQANQAFVLLHA